MLNKLKSIVTEFRNRDLQQIKQLRELEWAQIYHDSIRGNKALEHLPLNVGRWAGNYSFFYVLNRILADVQPKRILEMGLGESSKFISAHISEGLLNAEHVIIEHDPNWIDNFSKRFTLSEKSKVITLELEQKEKEGAKYNGYKGIEEVAIDSFDLYIVDGPFGTPRFSRFDITHFVQHIKPDQAFILILDDHDREGEKETAKNIFRLLESQNVAYCEGRYLGAKEQLIITSPNFKFLTSL